MLDRPSYRVKINETGGIHSSSHTGRNHVVPSSTLVLIIDGFRLASNFGKRYSLLRTDSGQSSFPCHAPPAGSDDKHTGIY